MSLREAINADLNPKLIKKLIMEASHPESELNHALTHACYINDAELAECAINAGANVAADGKWPVWTVRFSYPEPSDALRALLKVLTKACEEKRVTGTILRPAVSSRMPSLYFKE